MRWNLPWSRLEVEWRLRTAQRFGVRGWRAARDKDTRNIFIFLKIGFCNMSAVEVRLEILNGGDFVIGCLKQNDLLSSSIIRSYSFKSKYLA